jgi:hypothetical protein
MTGGNNHAATGLFLGLGSAPEQRRRPINHLDNIAIRQRKSRVRDAIFAAFVALGAIVSIGVMSTVAHAASTHLTSR